MTENWKNIPGFENYAEWYQKELQKHWEENNLTYQDAQQWISVGLEPADYEFASYLKKNNFNAIMYTF